jgi:Uma2 family endonuclease
MNSPVKKNKTVYDQWLEVADIKIGEIIMGELHVNPRPGPAHANSASELLNQIRDPYQKGKGGPGGWVILFEPELHLENDIFVPDIAGWVRERMPEMPQESFFNVTPDWICEVLSPSSAFVDRTKKMPLYDSLGVKYFWLVDPILKTVEVYKNESLQGVSRWFLLNTFSENSKVKAVPFDGIDIDLSYLWKF